MNQKTYNSVTGTLFLVIAVLHLVRIFNSSEAVIGAVEIPMWASWVAVVLAAYLAYSGLTKK